MIFSAGLFTMLNETECGEFLPRADFKLELVSILRQAIFLDTIPLNQFLILQ